MISRGLLNVGIGQARFGQVLAPLEQFVNPIGDSWIDSLSRRIARLTLEFAKPEIKHVKNFIELEF